MNKEEKVKLIEKWTIALKHTIQDSIDEELEKTIPRDDPRFMEMRKMVMPTVIFRGEVWKPRNRSAALCPPKWERKSSK